MTLYLLENRLPSFNGAPYSHLRGIAGADCSRSCGLLAAQDLAGPDPRRVTGPPPLHPGSAPNPDPLLGLSLYFLKFKWLNQEQANRQQGLYCQPRLDPCRAGKLTV